MLVWEGTIYKKNRFRDCYAESQNFQKFSMPVPSGRIAEKFQNKNKLNGLIAWLLIIGKQKSMHLCSDNFIELYYKLWKYYSKVKRFSTLILVSL